MIGASLSQVLPKIRVTTKQVKKKKKMNAKTTTLLIGTAFVGMGAFLWMRRENPPPLKQIQLGCHCGSITGVINTAEPSIPQAECCCSDCRRFLDKITGEKGYPDKEWRHVAAQAWKDELQITGGMERIQGSKLTDNATLIRCYANCCGTPLFFLVQASKYPMIPFYTCLAKHDDTGPVIWRLGAENCAIHDHSRDEGILTNGLTTDFILKTFCRAIWGLFNRKYGSNEIMNHVMAREIEILYPAKKLN